MPKFEEDELSAAPGKALTPKLMDLVERSRYSLMLLDRAAESKDCDWVLPVEQGVGLRMPHMSLARSLAQLACLQARVYIDNKETDAAMERLLTVMALARHVGPTTIIGMLVQHSIENQALHVFAENYGQWSSADLARWRQVVVVPRTGLLSQALEAERAIWHSQLPKLLRSDKLRVALEELMTVCDSQAFEAMFGDVKPGELRNGLADKVAQMSPEEYARGTSKVKFPAQDELVRRLRDIEAAMTEAGLEIPEDFAFLNIYAPGELGSASSKDLLADLEELYDEWAEISALPYAEAKPRWKMLAENTERSPIRKIMPGDLVVYHKKLAQHEARLGLSLAENVPTFDGKDKVVLTSDLKFDGKPVTLELRPGGRVSQQ
jgi:hypothetical protein